MPQGLFCEKCLQWMESAVWSRTSSALWNSRLSSGLTREGEVLDLQRRTTTWWRNSHDHRERRHSGAAWLNGTWWSEVIEDLQRERVEVSVTPEEESIISEWRSFMVVWSIPSWFHQYINIWSLELFIIWYNHLKQSKTSRSNFLLKLEKHSGLRRIYGSSKTLRKCF